MLTGSSSTARRTALTVGSEVPSGDFEFRVHSVFTSAMNLEVPGRRALVTLFGAEADEFPQGIRLLSRERFDTWPVGTGTPGRCVDGTLAFRGADGAECCAIDLRRAAVAKRTPPPPIEPNGERSREAWAVCAFHLAGLQEEKESDLRLATLCGVSPPPTTLGEHLAHAVRGLADALRADDPAAAAAAAAHVMGLGTGLTPTGDDFLCGLLAALWCASTEGGTERRFVKEMGAALSERLDSTNAISATFLECAIAGCFPGAVSALAAAFSGDFSGHAHEGPRRALDRLCALGHSSGADTATGFLFGLWLRTDDEMRRYAP